MTNTEQKRWAPYATLALAWGALALAWGALLWQFPAGGCG